MPLAPPAHNTSLFDADPFGDTADAPAPLTAQPAPLAEPSAFPEAPSGEVPPPLSAPPVGGNTGAPVQTFDAPQSPFAADPMPVEQAPATRQQASRQQASRQQAFPEPPQQQQPQRQPQATLFDREPFPENDFPTPAAPAATTLGQLTEEATHSPNVARNIGPTTTDMISPETTAVQLPEGTGIPGPKNIQGPQTAQVLIEKVFPEEIQVERQTTLKIRVRNVGKSTAEEVVLLDQVPQGTRLVSTSPQAQISPEGGLFWELGSIDPGKEIVAEMRIVPLREGEIGSVARVVFASSASGRSNVTRPQLKVEVRAPQQAMIGQMVNLDIVVSNPGTGTAEGVVLTEHVPEGLYNADGKKLLNKIGKLKPKETVKLTLPLKCTGSGKVANRLLVEAENTATVEENTVIDILAPKLQLNIAGAKTRYLERKAVYQLTVANPGTASAANVDLVCQLPTSMQFVSTNQSGLYEASTHTVHWALEELPAGEAGQIELVALPVKSGEHKLKFSGSGQNDLKGEAAHDVTIDGLAAVSFSVKCLSDLVEVGRDAVYEIAVVNRGTKASTNVIVGIQLSKGMSFVSAEGPAQYRADEGIVQFNPLGRIEPKSEKTYRVKARCLDDGDHRISVKLISDDLQAPITKEESTRVIK